MVYDPDLWNIELKADQLQRDLDAAWEALGPGIAGCLRGSVPLAEVVASDRRIIQEFKAEIDFLRSVIRKMKIVLKDSDYESYTKTHGNASKT